MDITIGLRKTLKRNPLTLANVDRWLTKTETTSDEKTVDTGRLTSFGEVELRGSVGAFAVVNTLHVAGVLVWSNVQSEAVSRLGLQGLWVLCKAGSWKNKTSFCQFLAFAC